MRSHSDSFVYSLRALTSQVSVSFAFSKCSSLQINFITLCQSSDLPTFPSHRGDSGINSMPMNWTAEGMPARPSIRRQLGLIAYARTDAITQAVHSTTTLKATIYPLISTGAASERYNGTICEAVPIAKPMISLPSISTPMVGAMAIITEPIVNNISANRMTFLRPNLSEKLPAIKAPIAAPIRAMETMSAIYPSVISGKSSTKYNWAPAITPVSQPNKKPPSAAVNTSYTKKHALQVFSVDFSFYENCA